MHSDQLYYLIILSKSHSINAASQQLHITPSALSISIKNLENELQMRLLNRTSRGITLTEHGKHIVKIAETFLNSIQQVQETAAMASASELSGDCRIYAVQGVLDNLLPKVIVAFYEQFPKLHITVDIAVIPEIISALNTPLQKHEFALVYSRMPEGAPPNMGSNCTFTPLAPVKLLAHIHDHFPIAHVKNPSIKSLFNYPIIVYSPSNETPEKNPSLSLLSTIGTPQKIILESNFHIYQNMIQQGMGIGFDVVSPLLSLNYPAMENIHTIIIKDCPTLYLGYLTNNTYTLSLAAQTFLDFLIDYIERNDISVR